MEAGALIYPMVTSPVSGGAWDWRAKPSSLVDVHRAVQQYATHTASLPDLSPGAVHTLLCCGLWMFTQNEVGSSPTPPSHPLLLTEWT